MKEIVIEQLQQRELGHLFNEADFKLYQKKAKTNGTGGNAYLIALNVFDMFVCNGSKQ